MPGGAGDERVAVEKHTREGDLRETVGLVKVLSGSVYPRTC
jgi:hypothetical protein